MRLSPPFQGTIFLDPNIITSADPTAFTSISYSGQDKRKMYDRRVNKHIRVTPFLFHASYDDGLSIEFQINPEFQNVDDAKLVALKYAEVIGQLPTALRIDIKTATVHKGDELFGGGNNDILIYTGQSLLYEKDGILEETLIHEASHTSLDSYHATSAGWVKAQKLDSAFISTYALDNPKREDIAETFLLYMAITYKSDRISASLKNKILETIPNRIAYFENQNLNTYPIE